MRLQQRIIYAFKFLRYRLFARHRKGHGIHSPFLFKLVHQVWQQEIPPADEQKMKHLARSNPSDHAIVDCNRAGAGSHISQKKMRRISSIFQSSGIPNRYGRLLHRVTAFYQPQLVLEFGTSLGISSAWMALGCPRARVYSVEAVPALAEKARQNHQEIDVQNIQVVTMDFNALIHKNELPQAASCLIFIDGDHTFKATLELFKYAVQNFYSEQLVVIIDDIHWSAGMEQAWKQIQQHERVRVTLDIFRMGLVFFDSNLSRQNFIIKY